MPVPDETLILLEGTVSSVIYRNEDNGYTILRLETDKPVMARLFRLEF